jgi:hypothetical protein
VLPPVGGAVVHPYFIVEPLLLAVFVLVDAVRVKAGTEFAPDFSMREVTAGASAACAIATGRHIGTGGVMWLEQEMDQESIGCTDCLKGHAGLAQFGKNLHSWASFAGRAMANFGAEAGDG